MNSQDNKFMKTKIHMFYVGLVLLGAFNWGTTALGFNLVEKLNNSFNNLIGRKTNLDKFIYIFIAISAIILAFQKKTWLPFLGEGVFPSSALVPNRVNKNGTLSIDIKVTPNTRIAYWASKKVEGKNIPNVKEAYGDFSNSGVVISDNDGNASLLITPSTAYIVPSGRKIRKHVHYRELDQEWGMIGKVQTVYY